MASDSGSYTPETIARRAKIAEALLKSATDPQPIDSWTQGLAQMARAGIGNYKLGEVEKMEAQRRYQDKVDTAEMLNLPPPSRPAMPQSNFDKIRDLLSGTSSSPDAAPATAARVPTGTPIAPSAMSGGATPENAPTAIPGGLPAPPRAGADAAPLPGATDMVARTAMLEAGNQGPVGQGAVAGVIKNRADQSGMGIPDVVTARNQFEPLNTPGGVAKFNAIDPQSPGYQTAAAATAPIIQGGAPDPSGGATHFYAPKAQAALGRQAPAWDNGTGRDIGDHRFFNLGYGGTGPNGTGGRVAAALAPTPEGPPMPPGMPGAGAMGGAAAPNMGAMAPVPAGMPSREQTEIPEGVRKRAAVMINNDDPAMKKAGYALLAQYQKPLPDTVITADYMRQNWQKLGFKGPDDPKLNEAITYRLSGVQHPFNRPPEEEGRLTFLKGGAEADQKSFNQMIDQGNHANVMLGQLSAMKELMKGAAPGSLAPLRTKLQGIAEYMGLDTSKMGNLADAQGIEALANLMAPSLRTPGVGSQSNFELDSFLKVLPGLSKSPGGNSIISDVMIKFAERKKAEAEIADQALTEGISRAEARKRIRDLGPVLGPDMMKEIRANAAAANKEDRGEAGEKARQPGANPQARNPKTGETIELINGKWVPVT